MQRDLWIDYVKLLACALVVIGHFFQSMVASEIITVNIVYKWFMTTIYYFHVQLFFICSGYLFQKYSRIRSFSSWKKNVIKKLLVLGVPYFVFSTITWGLKVIFSSSINIHVDGIFVSLFVKPMAPYWYLYTLFFMFACSVTIMHRKEMIYLLACGFFLKIISILNIYSGIYAIDKTAEHYIWFVIGVLLGYSNLNLLNLKLGVVVGIVFIIASVMLVTSGIESKWVAFILGLLACYAIISIIYNSKISKIVCVEWLAKYTMPIFLMHTICAASFRGVLIRFGVLNSAIHIIFGVAISFMGPIVVMTFLKKLKPLDFVVNANEYLHF